MFMQIVISRSAKPDKKFEARIDGRKSIHFGQAGAVILHNIKIYSVRRGIYNGILKMKTGIIP
jgi:hypothetical protein